MTEFTDDEMRAIAVLVRYAAQRCGGGEDTIGAILYTGAFRQLRPGDGRVVALATKIDEHLPEESSKSEKD